MDQRRITFRGEPVGLHLLVDELERQGVTAEYDPPQERRDMQGATQHVVVQMLADGPPGAVRIAIECWRRSTPRGEVDVEGEPENPPKDAPEYDIGGEG